MVKVAEAPEPLEAAITLLCSGMLISGFVVSMKKYMQHSDLTKLMDESFDAFQQDAIGLFPEDSGRRRFIHLRDARYFTPGMQPIPGNASVYVRIKISDVSGFHLGHLSLANDQSD